MIADVKTDVLVVGAGAAGMYAAITAARNNADTVLIDKSLIGRGGATIMAQMTVAAAVSEQEPDHWTLHLNDIDSVVAVLSVPVFFLSLFVSMW